MRDAQGFAKLPVALALVTALWGCASRPSEHFYTVSNRSVAADSGAAARRMTVSPILIPALIDRPQLVVRTDAHEITLLESHRWAQPLSVDLGRALVGDLRRARPQLGVVAVDDRRTGLSEQSLEVIITELVSGPGPSTSFEASWVLHDRLRDCVNEGHFEAAIPTQAGYQGIPAAYADAMSRLAGAIARTIPEGGGSPCQALPPREELSGNR